ncbi:hypothetical protein DYB28_001365 [Aphanomyces astaci]|uniref:Phosphatidylinositol transfer protein N-terminal domain-containing protein n=1 Tax=Aphanomyces astaci TaxID=112090 RepID=A0A397BEL9_APHAT|nr:hypothetical protein DYB25_006972 [Aphanomyces astaci]RHY18943.1 hypothetical protein DYB36_010417 [Aphanomyces astaci]RHY50720.1 hypothetical protein DYB38_009303 [Aphanomyces astaci]RHY55014.1 hypothetical protein DYB34_002938 [Aphanomyces astaci]RHY58079.1 hypothetical protein DYB30_005668 [Aphanomyces astaci]
MLIHEFRVPVHMTVEEFQVAQLYMVVDASEKNTKDGEGVEILKNEPYDNTNGQVGDISAISNVKIPRNKGQYTLKHYHVKSHIPSYVSAIIRIDSNLPNETPTPQALEFDPSTYTCPKTGRGPLAPGWEVKVTPVMTCHKVVRVKFDYWGFQGRVETAIRDRQRRLFHSSLRQVGYMIRYGQNRKLNVVGVYIGAMLVAQVERPDHG